MLLRKIFICADMLRGMRVFLSFMMIFFCVRTTDQVDIDICHAKLGLKDGRIPDSALKASSSHDPPSVGPQNARLHSDSGGGAWCPERAISQETIGEEYLEIDLGSLTIITGILSQGRFGNGRGQEYAEAYKIHYTRAGMTDFKEYRDSLGRTILPGNVNTYNVANNTLLPSIFADKIRLFPYSEHTRTVCMRVELLGCLFTEGVLAYSIPQGMVRGSVLELMDHTYDGQEDSLTGELSGGLGQLVDGRYGNDNFKSLGENGHMKGYDWIGWKKKGNSFNMMFNFDTMRTFHTVDIHANNHFTKDISVFSKAKIYFSNEEGKFADDRVVEFKYMPDVVLENARNVSINLKGEHGQYVMIQLTFDKKWILISEVTFRSEPRAQILFTEPPPQVYEDIHHRNDYRDEIHLNIEGKDFDLRNHGNNKSPSSPPTDASTDQAGILIGTLITFIAILLAGIAYVSYRNSRRNSDKTTPTHHPILSSKFADHFFGPSDSQGAAERRRRGRNGGGNNNNKMFFPSHQHLHQRIVETPPVRQDTIYEEPSALYSAAGFLSLNRKFSTDPLSEDGSDDYAEPNALIPVTENPYASTTLTKKSLIRNDDILSSRPLVKPASLPISHYSRPLSPTSKIPRSPSGGSNSTLQNTSIHSNNNPPNINTPPSTSSMFSPNNKHGGLLVGDHRDLATTPNTSSSSSSSNGRRKSKSSQNDTNNCVLNMVDNFQRAPPNRGTKLISPTSTTTSNNTVTEGDEACFDENTTTPTRYNLPDLNKLYAQINENKNDSLVIGSTMSPRPETSVDTLNVELNEIKRSELCVLEKLGEGQFGEIHLCKWKKELVAVKSLKGGCDTSTRSDFEHEARILTTLTDPNLVRVLGVSFKDDVYCMICEYTERGDLYQFLQDHVAETTLSKSPGVPTLSYGCLIYLAAQIASGMKYLESLNFVHRDLATRNVLVDVTARGIVLKISDFGMSRSMYKNDYYKSQAGCLLPIRWMAWESVLMGKFTTKSDVWSFAVTLWEILTFAREQPFESLSDDKVIASLSSVYQNGVSLVHLPTPYGCPREVRDLMTECWQREESERPSFQEIHLFLQRKNLGYSPSHDISFLNKCKQNNKQSKH
uniref:Discoidin domaincontaining receptor 2like [Bombus impatiens] n=1 Tax=Lepeophtheirus salmonis TaxID=72036 RepID=A0A0K2T0M4_LEPSM